MKTYEIDIRDIGSNSDFVSFLDEHEVKEGDVLKVRIYGIEMKFLIMALLVVLTHAFAVHFRRKFKQREEEGQKIIDSVFESKSIEDIEKQIKNEYGVKIEIELGNSEDDEWRKMSQIAMSKAYGEDEPEYTMANIKEPNPLYKK